MAQEEGALIGDVAPAAASPASYPPAEENPQPTPRKTRVRLRSEMQLILRPSSLAVASKERDATGLDMDAWGSFLPRMTIEQLSELNAQPHDESVEQGGIVVRIKDVRLRVELRCFIGRGVQQRLVVNRARDVHEAAIRAQVGKAVHGAVLLIR